MDKVVGSAAEAVSDIEPGNVIGFGGFGVIHGFPLYLTVALRGRNLRNLTAVTNGLGAQPEHPVSLVERGQVSRLVAAFSARAGNVVGSAHALSPVPIEVELVPQGLLVERLRAAGAGIGPFYSPVGEDTLLAEGKERREFNGRRYVLEQPLALDYAFIYAHAADRAGNLVFRGANKNLAPAFAKAARVVIAEVDDIVEVGELDPNRIGLPGIFVDRVVKSPGPRVPQWREPRAEQDRREYLGRPGRTSQEIAARIAALLPDGSYVNLGVGLPTLVSDHLASRDVWLHAENGLLGYGSRLRPDSADNDLYNAGGEPVSVRPGAAAFDSVEAFEMARGGHLDAVVLGAYQVGADGSFANWTTPTMNGGAIGGAMDLVVAPGKLIIAMWHCERSGQPKVIREITYPPTRRQCVDVVVTDLAVIERDERGLVLRECAPGFTPAQVQQLTDAPLTVELWAEVSDPSQSRLIAWRESIELIRSGQYSAAQ